MQHAFLSQTKLLTTKGASQIATEKCKCGKAVKDIYCTLPNPMVLAALLSSFYSFSPHFLLEDPRRLRLGSGSIMSKLNSSKLDQQVKNCLSL